MVTYAYINGVLIAVESLISAYPANPLFEKLLALRPPTSRVGSMTRVDHSAATPTMITARLRLHRGCHSCGLC
eukprot:3740691-Pyramimonas_sp.AAC.1